MISDDVGGSENVNGNRIAMVVIGAMPGSTPTSVPISAPRKQKPRLAGVSATAKPVARLAIRSTPVLHSSWPHRDFRPDLDRQPEHGDEQQHRKDRERDRQKRVLTQPHVVSGEPRTDHHREAG